MRFCLGELSLVEDFELAVCVDVEVVEVDVEVAAVVLGDELPHAVNQSVAEIAIATATERPICRMENICLSCFRLECLSARLYGHRAKGGASVRDGPPKRG